MKKLTVKQLKVAQLFADPTLKTVIEVSEAAEVSTHTIYKWLKDDEFKAQIQTLINGFTDGELSNVWKALIEKCLKGDIPAIKLFFELKGKYKPENVFADAVVVNIIDDVPFGTTP